MNTKNKLNKKVIKTIMTMALVAVFLIGEIFSPFATLANAANHGKSTETVKVIVKDADTNQMINRANITFNGPGSSGKISSGISGTYADGVCYIDVHNGAEKIGGVTATIDNHPEYTAYNIYDNNNIYYVTKGVANERVKINGSDKSPTTITIEFKTTGTITGTVKDNNSNIIGAKVSVGRIVTYTDANGSYTLNNVPAGQVMVTASKDGYNSQSYTETVVGGGNYTHDFILTKIVTAGTITGNVKDEKNSNIVGAKVSAGGIVETVTNTNGNYTLNNVPAGQVIVTASKDGYSTQSYTETVVGGGNYNHNFVLINLSLPEVKIDVTDASGILDEYYARSDNTSQRVDKDVTDKNYVLKGDSYANFSLNSSNANAFQYSIITGNKPTDMPINGWNDINLQSQVVNEDVVLDKQGYLTQRAYDVNHMLTLTDTKNWSDPTQVFKYPYPEIGYKDAGISTTVSDYGKMENVVPYTMKDVNDKTITVNSRWASNTAFMNNMDIFGGYKEASKFWGYIRVPEDGNYILGAVSDDGCRGWVTVDGETKQFVDMFKPQEATFGTKNVTLTLKSGKYYPLYLEYFNWGGSAAFQLNYVKNQGTLTDSNKTVIPKEWFFPSKSTTPGEYAQTLFTGSKGVKLPDNPGKYYIAYRTGTKNSDGSDDFSKNCREGIYGPFIVKPTAPLVLTREATGDLVAGKSFEITYTIKPESINSEDFDSTNTQNFEVTNLKFSEYLPKGLKIDDSHQIDSNKLQIVSNGNDIDGYHLSGAIMPTIKYTLNSTENKYTAQPISFSIWVKSDTVSNYNMSGEDSYITYLDLDNGTRSANFNDLQVAVTDGQSSILDHGLYNGNGTEITDGNNVTAAMPVTLAMIVDAESSNPVINWSADKTKIVEENIVFKKYAINNNVITGSPETGTLNNSGNLTGFTMGKGNKYIIIYTITPKASGSITVTATADGTSSKSVTLNIGEKPDLF